MNPMEFINDSYAQWDLTYWANGLILNYIPIIKRLKLREAFMFKGVWGHLSDRNKPWLNPDLYGFPEINNTQLMSDTPYMEVGVGLDNLLKVFRVDYTRRLTYRDNPGACKQGLRFTFHFSFENRHEHKSAFQNLYRKEVLQYTTVCQCTPSER